MRARGRAHDPDALRIDAELAGLAAHELHAGQNVVYGLRISLALRGQAVADRKYSHATRRQIRAPVLKCGAHALHPSAAVHGNECWDFLRAGWQIEVAQKLYAVVRGVGDSGLGVDTLLSHFVHLVSAFRRYL